MNSAATKLFADWSKAPPTFLSPLPFASEETVDEIHLRAHRFPSLADPDRTGLCRRQAVDRQAAHRRGTVSADDGFAQTVQMSGLVPRRQVRHLGPLGSAGRADGRRLVRPRHLRAGQRPLQVPHRALRPPVEVRLQGHHPAVEGREVGSRSPHAALQEGRGQVFRQHGLAPRRLLPLELQAAQVERREHGPQARRGRRLAEGGQEVRPAVRRLRAPRRQLLAGSK